MFLQSFPPMGVYETLFKFMDATGHYMGDSGTHPWAQGFPLTKQLPDGPPMPKTVHLDWTDLKYPQATGTEPLLVAVRDYYNTFYNCNLTTDNICIFAGGRPGIFATLVFLLPEIRVLIEETEYTPYYDMLRLFDRAHSLIPSNPQNSFRPTIDEYRQQIDESESPSLIVKSNPCNPTGVTWAGDHLKNLVDLACQPRCGAIIDEAYEFFHNPDPVSSLEFISNIDETNIFVVGAATKGLQAPGARTGWVIASRQHIEIFRNFSSIAMGGVSRPSQRYVTDLLDIHRVGHARKAVCEFFTSQRIRYGAALDRLGVELFTGSGGFYHWGRLPGGLTADEFNERLFKHRAGILPGTLCDMLRRGDESPMSTMMRFSFGPLESTSFDDDVKILERCLQPTGVAT